ncbi:MAG: hypothetical protein IKE91_00435 [Clostridia bacterium]|nr:hypothetical protein [Clostridia bacterium]
MPEEYNGWKLIKEYENFGLYTNGKWNECFSRFDVGMVEKQKLVEVRLFNASPNGKKWER